MLETNTETILKFYIEEGLELIHNAVPLQVGERLSSSDFYDKNQ